MSTFEIPGYKLVNLAKKIKRVNNKGANIKFELISSERKELFPDILVKCYTIEVEGEYKINGWKFLATLEHTKNGNIIRRADLDDLIKIPDKYKTCEPYCDHCKTLRDRKDTYLIYNEETKEIKQVGKTCLLDYTQGLDAKKCAELASIIEELKENTKIELEDDEMIEFKKYLIASEEADLTAESVKSTALYEVVKHGYTPHETVINIQNLIFNNKSEYLSNSKELLKNIDEWAKNVDDSNDYMRNAKLCWLKNSYSVRDFALIASFINCYFKDIEFKKQKEANKKSSKYVGNIGDKITIKVESFRVLFTNWLYGEESKTYLIKDIDNNTYIWKTTKDLEGISEIYAKVVGFKEFNGIKQTVISYGKVK